MKWTECCREARRRLGFDGVGPDGKKRFVPIGGASEDGQKLLALVRQLHTETGGLQRIKVPRKRPTRETPWRPARPRDNLTDLREFVDYGRTEVNVSEEPSFYPGVSFKNGNTFKQVRGKRDPRDLDSWCVSWPVPEEIGAGAGSGDPGSCLEQGLGQKNKREFRHFYVGQFYIPGDEDYSRAKERARQFAIEFRKEKVREMDRRQIKTDKENFTRLSTLGKQHEYKPPRNRVAARQSGCQGVTWMTTTQDWQVQVRNWDPALRKSKVVKQCHVKVELPYGVGVGDDEDQEAVERAIEEARVRAIAIRKEWEKKYRSYTVKHFSSQPKYDEIGRLVEDEPDVEMGVNYS